MVQRDGGTGGDANGELPSSGNAKCRDGPSTQMRMDVHRAQIPHGNFTRTPQTKVVSKKNDSNNFCIVE